MLHFTHAERDGRGDARILDEGVVTVLVASTEPSNSLLGTWKMEMGGGGVGSLCLIKFARSKRFRTLQ